MSVVRVVDRRNRVNTDHNWAVVHEIKYPTRTDKQTIKGTNTKKEAMEKAREWMKRNENYGG